MTSQELKKTLWEAADKVERLTAQFAEQMAHGAELDAVIRQKPGTLGYDI